MDPKTIGNAKAGWDVLLSESSDEEEDDWTEWNPKQVKIKEREVVDHRVGGLKDHDYCQESFQISQVDPTEKEEKEEMPEPKEELSEMDKILGEVRVNALDNS